MGAPNSCRGFSLLEAVMVIAITGIVAAMVGVFMRAPVDSYVDSTRRAWLTDVADTALRRIARDVQGALPNSLRPLGSGQSLELLLTSAGGRYSQDAADAADCFVAGCTSLTTLGSVIAANNELVGQRLVIYSLHPNDSGGCSATNPSAWCGNNSASITASTNSGNADILSFASTSFQPNTGSPTRRFFVVSGPVGYVCSGVGTLDGRGTGQLLRYEGYAITDASTLPSPAGVGRVLAHNVSACNFSYSAGATERGGLLTFYLEIMEGNERVGLYHEVHVDNAP